MGGGLVLFGIGGDVSGGLFDAFSDGSGGEHATTSSRSASSATRSACRRTRRTRSRSRRSCATTTQLAVSPAGVGRDRVPGTTPRTTCARRAPTGSATSTAESEGTRPRRSPRSRCASTTWGPSTRPKEAAAGGDDHRRGVERLVQRYLQLVQYAALAKDKRTADLAALKRQWTSRRRTSARRGEDAGRGAEAAAAEQQQPAADVRYAIAGLAAPATPATRTRQGET